MARYAGFERRTIRFLEKPRANNEREWFKANKSRYEDDVLDVALRELDVGDCLELQFQRSVEASFRLAEPFMRFLCKAVGVRF